MREIASRRLVLGFVFLFACSPDEGISTNSLATVNGQPIETSELPDTWQSLSPKARRYVLDQLIDRKLAVSEARARGLEEFSEEEIREIEDEADRRIEDLLILALREDLARTSSVSPSDVEEAHSRASRFQRVLKIRHIDGLPEDTADAIVDGTVSTKDWTVEPRVSTRELPARLVQPVLGLQKAGQRAKFRTSSEGQWGVVELLEDDPTGIVPLEIVADRIKEGLHQQRATELYSEFLRSARESAVISVSEDALGDGRAKE